MVITLAWRMHKINVIHDLLSQIDVPLKEIFIMGT